MTAATTIRNRGAALLAALLAVGVFAIPAPGTTTSTVEVVVRAVDGVNLTQTIERLGGEIITQTQVLNSVTAIVPTHAVDDLEAASGVASVTHNGTVTLNSAGWEAKGNLPETTLHDIIKGTGAESYWKAGSYGQGVTVALIDSGVAPVDGMTAPGKVINGPDLSFDSQIKGLEYLDAFGHGTHMAGIIAGRSDRAPARPSAKDAKDNFLGLAPDARILNVKVGAANGAADVSQVLAGIDWVIQHRNDNGMNVRVLNLSFGTDSHQAYELDPLSHAVEVAWHHGIVVVVAAGNDGNRNPLRNPAINPYVIAVGSSYDQGTRKNLADDIVMDFSNCGTIARSVDVVTAGKSILSLRVPGSYADVTAPSAAFGENLFRGTGTSQSAAVVSGIAALLISQHPDLSPDAVKSQLMATALPIANASERCQGAGDVFVKQLLTTDVKPVRQSWPHATGLGTLEGARGTDHLTSNGITLVGEIDIFGQAYLSELQAKLTANGSSWSGGVWNGSSWSGSSWSGSSWSGSSWSGSSWSGSSWSGSSWSGSSWSAAVWTGSSWSGSSWSGSSWSGSSWSGSNWSGLSWDHGKRNIN